MYLLIIFKSHLRRIFSHYKKFPSVNSKSSTFFALRRGLPRSEMNFLLQEDVDLRLFFLESRLKESIMIVSIQHHNNLGLLYNRNFSLLKENFFYDQECI